MSEAQEFYVTFGQKYRHLPHSRFPKAHPDGWFRLLVMSYEDAQKVAAMLFGADGYSMVYQVNDFWPVSLYPRGELGVWDIRSVMDD